MSIDFTAERVDVAEITKRVDELEDIEGIEEKIENLEEDDEAEELVGLRELLCELQGEGGDHQWRGDWYPATLINDAHFTDYAKELADDLGETADDVKWPYTCIDWDAAASELQADYNYIDHAGEGFWFR